MIYVPQSVDKWFVGYYSGYMPPKKKQPGRELEKRFEALFGGHGTTALLARALGRSQSGLHRIWAGILPTPDELIAVVELLEALPREQWPKRWRE